MGLTKIGIVELLTFFGSLFISAAVCVVSYYVILYVRDQGQKNKDLATLLGPMILIFLIGWVISKLFAHIWETSADAILHCYCIDEKIQAEKGRQVKYARKKLKKLLE